MLATPTAWSQSDTNAARQVPVGGAANQQWPRFLGKGIDGVVQVDREFDWSSTPQFRWSIDVGEGYGIGTVAGGKYFHYDATFDRTSRLSRERLRRFDLQSGQQEWSQSDELIYRDLFGYEDGPRTSPLLHGDRVITFGVAGLLTCRDLRNGRKIWSVDTAKQYSVVQNFFGVGSSPLVIDDQLIVMVGGSPPEDQNVPPMRLDMVSANGSAIVAFDLKTGAELWKCGNDLASYSSPRPIEIDGAVYVLAFARGGLMLIDPRQGTVRWRFDHRASKLESVNAMVPVVVDSLVLISECYEVGSALLRVSADGSEVVWRDRQARRDRDLRQLSFRSHWATPLVIDGRIYGGNGRNPSDSDFRCVDLNTGNVLWTDPRSIRSTATQVGDHVLVLEEQGRLQVIRPNPEKLDVVAQWRLDQADGERPALRFPCWAAPVVVGNKLLVRGDKKVICLELK